MSPPDAHYDQVMKARAAAGQGTKLYFAYSTILDRAAFLEWRSQHGYDFFELPEGELAEATGVGLVFDFPSRFWGGRVAGLADRPGQSVHGRLFSIPEGDWAILQHKEGAVTGMCVEKAVQVRAGGRTVEAIAFTTAPGRQSLDGPVSPRFLEALTRGAAAAGLPPTWLAAIRAAAL